MLALAISALAVQGVFPVAPEEMPFAELARVQVPTAADECSIDLGDSSRLDIMTHFSADGRIGYDVLIFRPRGRTDFAPGTALRQQGWSGRHHARIMATTGGQVVVAIDARAVRNLWFDEYLLFGPAEGGQSEARLVVPSGDNVRFQRRTMPMRQALGEMLDCHAEAGL